MLRCCAVLITSQKKDGGRIPTNYWGSVVPNKSECTQDDLTRPQGLTRGKHVHSLGGKRTTPTVKSGTTEGEKCQLDAN